MSYNGRAVMQEVATANGWETVTLTATHVALPDAQWVAYLTGNSPEVVIAWTPDNTAAYVAIAGRGRVQGMTALIEARRHIETHAA
jgi:hypothetical protein